MKNFLVSIKFVSIVLCLFGISFYAFPCDDQLSKQKYCFSTISSVCSGYLQGTASVLDLVDIHPDRIVYKVHYQKEASSRPRDNFNPNGCIEFSSHELINVNKFIDNNCLIITNNTLKGICYSVNLPNNMQCISKSFPIAKSLFSQQEDVFLLTKQELPLSILKGRLCSPLLLIGLDDNFLFYEGNYRSYAGNRDQNTIIIKSKALIKPFDNQSYVYLVLEDDNDGLMSSQLTIPANTQVKEYIPFISLYLALRDIGLPKELIGYIMLLLKERRFT